MNNLTTATVSSSPILTKTSSTPSGTPSSARNTTKNSSGKNASSRDEKRKRWAKNNKPKAKPVTPKPNAKEYISACCNVPARKPAAGQKTAVRNPETGKTKSEPKGLGKWRCGQCGKTCKVSAQKSAPREAKNSAEIAPIKTEFNPPALETIVLTKSFPIAPPGVVARVVTFGDVKVALPGPSSVMDGEPDVSTESGRIQCATPNLSNEPKGTR